MVLIGIDPYPYQYLVQYIPKLPFSWGNWGEPQHQPLGSTFCWSGVGCGTQHAGGAEPVWKGNEAGSVPEMGFLTWLWIRYVFENLMGNLTRIGENYASRMGYELPKTVNWMVFIVTGNTQMLRCSPKYSPNPAKSTKNPPKLHQPTKTHSQVVFERFWEII